MENRNRPTFAIATLPLLPDIVANKGQHFQLAQKYRDLRLLALQTSPEAFASSYEVESQRSLDETVKRLSNSKAVHFVAVEDKHDNSKCIDKQKDLQRLLNSEWIGMIVLLGPETEQSPAVSAQLDPFARMTAIATLDNHPETVEGIRAEEQTLHYHLNSVFVTPTARKAGLGQLLIKAAFARAETVAKTEEARWYCTVLVDSKNQAARSLYEKAGIVVVGEETYFQQPRALVAGESHAEVKVALLMELHRAVSHAKDATAESAAA